MNAQAKKKFLDRQLADFVKFSGLRQDETFNLLVRFSSICRQLDVINEEECNSGLSELSKRREKLLAREAKEVAEALGCKLHHQGDPRGPAIRLIRPDKNYNCMDGETWFVDLNGEG